jgi:hypothetical protein
MLKGDLSTTPLAPLLIDLARISATGSLIIVADDGEEAQLYLKAGLVYAVQVPGARPQLGSKLVSSGALAPEALADALEAQRTELQGWRLGELLVHLGYVEQTVVEAFVKEQVNDAMWDLMRWHDGRWRFRKNMKTREDVAPPMEVVDLLSVLRERGYEWETISSVVHGPSAVPTLSTGGIANPETVLDPEAWSMLCKIDGERSVADLARDCGYTLFEAGHVIVSLVHAGLVDIEEDVDVSGQTPYGASTLSDAWNENTESAEGGRAWQDDSTTMDPSDDAEGDALSRLARLVTEVAGGHPPEAADTRAPTPNRTLAEPWTRGVEADESFAVALAKVSSALIDVLGPADPAAADPFDLPRDLRKPSKHETADSPDDPEWDRRSKLRSAAAAELAAAHALAEALRPSDAHHVALAEAEPESSEPDAVADPAEDDEAAQLAAEEAARLTAEEEAARVAAEDEAARLAAEEEAARVAAEEAEAARLAAEEEAARVAAEEEAARVAAEEEAARVAAEEEAARVAAEEEAARLAAEEAEAARLTAEEEAARIAAEEEAARVAAEEEAARVAAEEEAARVAAEEEAARVAAEEEAARVAAEEEAARVAAEEEAARVAAEAEAARIAADEEAARLAAEAEAARVAAEEEAARVAAEEEAARVAAEEAEALRIAAEEEAARVAAEEAEAARIAAEEEAARVAAEEEAARLAAEEEAARVTAAEEEARLAAEAAAEAADAQLAAEEFARLAAEEEADLISAAEEAARLEAEADAAREVEVEDVEVQAAQRAADAIERDEADRRASEAAALLGQLSAEPLLPEVDPAAAEVEAEATDPPERDTSMDDDDDLYPMKRNEDMADTAALLRELSSLGNEEGDSDSSSAPPPSPRVPQRPAQGTGNDKKQRKKIGLFGL